MSDAATKVGADKVAQQIRPLNSNQSDKEIFREASSTNSERILDDFQTDESVSKFVKGETIIDKENPFKSLDEDDLIDTVNYFKSGAYKQNNCDINVQKRIFNPTYRNIRIPLENNRALKIEPYSMSEPTPTERSIQDVPESIHDSMNSIGLSDVSDVETVSSGDFVYFPSAVLDTKKNNFENSSAHPTEVPKSDAIPADKAKKKNGGLRKIFPSLFSHSSKGKLDSIEKNQTGKKYENDSKQILKLNNSLEEKQSISPNKQLYFTRNSNHTDIIQTSYDTAKQPIAERENDIIVSMKDLPKTVKPKPPIRQASLREDARKFEVEIRRKDAFAKNGKAQLKSGRASVPLTKKESDFIAWTNPLDNLNKNTQINNTKVNFNKPRDDLNDDINLKKKAPKAPPRSFAQVKKEPPVGDDDVFFHTFDNDHGERIDASHTVPLASDIKSVGAQMKISTTNVMLSPKKEAEVRIRKEMRARSISPVQNTEIQCDDEFVYDNKIPEKVYSPPESPKISGQQSNTKGTPTSSQYNMANLRAYYLNHKSRVEMQKNSVDSLSDVEYSKVQELKASSLCSANNNSAGPHSPQKMKNLQNVEAFYWQQIRQMKMKQEQEFIEQALQNSNISLEATTNKYDFFQPELDRRARSVSPAFRGNERRSLSLTRGHDLYSRVIGKGASKVAAVDNKIYQNFNRGDALRQTVDYVDPRIQPEFKDVEFRKPHVQSRTVHLRSQSVLDDMITRNSDLAINGAKVEVKLTPIFKRGSLISNSQDESPSREKRVSFSSKNTADNMYENYLGRQSLYEGAGVPENTYGKIMKPDRGRVPEDITLNGKIVLRRDIGAEDQVAKGTQQVAVPVSRGTAASTARNLLSRRVLSSPYPKTSSEDGPKDDIGSETSELKRILRAVTRRRALLNETVSDSGGSDSARIPGVDIRSGGGGSRAGRQARRDDPRRHTLGGDHLYQSQQQTPLQAQQQGVMRTMDLQPPLPRGYPPSSAMLFDDDPGIMSEVETASTGFRRGGKQRSSLPVVRTPSKTLERPLGLVFLQYRNETKRALLPNEITSIDTVKALFVRSFPKQLTMEYLDSPLVKIYIHDSSKDMFYELEDLRSHLRDIRDRSVLRLFESADVSGGAFPGSLGAGSGVAPAPVSGPPSWDQDQSYFSEPEFDSDYHHQHIHKSKVNNSKAAPAYYMGSAVPTTLPRGTTVMRAYSPASGHPIPADRMKSLPATAGAPPKPLRSYGGPVAGIRGGSERCFPFTPPSVDAIRGADQLYSLPADRVHNDGYMSSPERSSRGPYEEPYYTQYVGPQPRGGMTPVIDEEASDGALLEDQYGLYGVKIPPGSRANRAPGYETARLNSHATNDELAQRIRVEHMERQLANLTGLVAKALQAPVVSGPGATPPLGGECAGYGVRNSTSAQEAVDPYMRTERPPKLGKGRCHKSVSFEKSVSFSDEPPDMNSPKQHSPQHSADSKPPKPAIKSSTLPRTSSQERDRLKPAPPPKPAALIGPQLSLTGSQMIPMGMSMDMYTQLKILHKKCKDLRMEMRNLRRMTLAQVHTVREMICDTFVKIRSLTNNGGDMCFSEENLRLAREEEAYNQVMLKLESDLTDLESTVERLRGNVINRKTRVNMVDVEKMALVLSKSSKTVADLKLRFPILQDGMKGLMSNEMEKPFQEDYEFLLEKDVNSSSNSPLITSEREYNVVRDEKFLKEEPERLEIVLKRCKKLTGTLVTLKRLASVQEQRLPCAEDLEDPGADGQDLDGSHHDMSAASTQTNNKAMGGGLAAISVGGDSLSDSQRPENALDALLDELQTFARPGSQEGGSFRRLHTEISNLPPVRPRGQASTNKPPVPERHPELLVLAARRPPPPPPPRTTSRSPLASPLTSPASSASQANHRHHASSHASALNPIQSASNSSSCESVNSQEGVGRSKGNNSRHELLEQRHQELLKKQKALQEQYARLQMIQKGNNSTDCDKPDLKKTGSESNLLHKMGMNMVQAASGSLTHLASVPVKKPFEQTTPTTEDQSAFSKEDNAPTSTVNKIYETDIL